MASIANPGVWPITLATGHIVPGRGSLETTNEVIRSPDNHASLRGMALAGHIVLTMDPDPAPPREAAAFIEAPAFTGPLIGEAPAEETAPPPLEAPAITHQPEPAKAEKPEAAEEPAIVEPKAAPLKPMKGA